MNRKYLDLIINENNLDAIISYSPQTRLWLTTIQSTDGMVVIEKSKSYVLVDSRYIEYAQKQVKNAELILLTADNLKKLLENKKYQRIGIEEDYLTLGEFNRIKKFFPNAEFVEISGQKLRILKDENEIANLQKAIDISLEAYNQLIAEIKEGQTEREIDRRLNFLMKEKGAQKECFDSIIATGSNSAIPHHHPTDRKIKKGDLLKIDFGAVYNGYGADITRTFIFGDKANDPKAEEILQIVKEAAQKGRQMVKPGIKASEVDKVCRDYIQSKGYGKYFLHSTGHGLGIDVHELPNVSSSSDFILEEGMVITVEPGIYIEGLGGARIEDDLLVTKTGSITLSRKGEINGK
ncbi:aminopeptidase P family protein [Mesomycoplasma lagogenitalium]|uniref:Aminopeptidase P family protein n=1 Tax=Mesomycoplasma lagogenitalium TaxID=171286 RepID=A0ABY8LUH3_9BACT|nr:aminopeptidase P family protein [Mesomycoplasma lagogenitalium]WGI36887.1 aminopeptidase P family protein [Mesomycoplasma lagogenitalium]